MVKKGSRTIDMGASVSAKERDWIESCVLAAKSDDFFRHFRSVNAFRRVIEGSTKESGLWNLKRLLDNPLFVKTLPMIRDSDTIGSPLQMVEFTLKLPSKRAELMSLSPTTIRYTNNALNCISLFGKKILDSSVDVYEIGAGYGGESKIFNDFAVSIYGSPIRNWHIYDLDTSTGIIKRFLSKFGYSAIFNKLKATLIKDSNLGLVISNGAFSEMRGGLLDEYFEKIICKAKYGYFITNFESHSAPYGGWSTQEFIDRLHSAGKLDAVCLPVNEYLSYFDTQAGSKLIVFGHKKIRQDSTKLQDIVAIKFISMINEILNVFIAKYIGSK